MPRRKANLPSLPAPPPTPTTARSNSASPPELPPTANLFESESVIIPMTSLRRHLLVHPLRLSRVGCRMGCTFCETGRMGLLRNLSAGEIVRQRLVARQLRVKEICNFLVANAAARIYDLQSTRQLPERKQPLLLRRHPKHRLHGYGEP